MVQRQLPVTTMLLPAEETVTKAEAEMKEGQAKEAEGSQDKNVAEVQTRYTCLYKCPYTCPYTCTCLRKCQCMCLDK